MKLGDLLVAEKLVSREQVDAALALQVGSSRRLGEILVTSGALSGEDFEQFLHRVPKEPDTLEQTGIDEKTLLGLMLKLIYASRLETASQIAAAIKLPQHLISELVTKAIARRLLRALGERERQLAYALTDEGLQWAQEALQQSQYAGPAPVPLEDFVRQVCLQKLGQDAVRFADIRAALGELTVSDRFIEQLGPALNSGRAMLLYGPPGNGKTSVAHRFAALFDDMIHVPYAVLVGGQIIRIFDASVHLPPELAPSTANAGVAPLRREESDARWVACRRPFVVTGGELTLEMLDLQFNASANFYEAPLHVKALGGCFVIDDFGRQMVSPKQLLNRWIVPMEERVDYLKLHTGKSFALPFEALLVFSTNLEPEALMDPAFLRRLPYKLDVGAPTRAAYRSIFDKVCQRHGLSLGEDLFEVIVHSVTDNKGLPLAAYQPQFIVEQVLASCRFAGEPPHFEARYIEYAVDNLRVNRRQTP